MKMNAELKELLESKKGQIMVICATVGGVTRDKGDFKATLTEVIGDSGVVVIGDFIRINLDHVLAFWFESP